MCSEEVEKRRRGRPRALEPASSSITVWVKAADHERVAALARREEKAISRLIRELLERRLG
jgi:cytidylate kinase